ncbi:MAG: family 78 glycoside hydrolase catalytic domain [Thermoproteota archaeon]
MKMAVSAVIFSILLNIQPSQKCFGIRDDELFAPIDLMCEYVSNPLGVDTFNPRFSWTLKSSRRGEVQTAYQILVSEDLENLSKDVGDMWDSGKVVSGDSAGVEYAGKTLKSGSTYYWKVRCWNGENQPSAFSEPALFHTGLFTSEDWKAKWIESPSDNNSIAPLFRKTFTVDREVRRAYAYVCGLGYYELYINGVKVSDHVLDPGTTKYDMMALYVVHNITRFLRFGNNVIGIILGNGWFSPLDNGVVRYSKKPRLLMQIDIQCSDSSNILIVTDETWRTTDGPILYNSIWGGEFYDARLEKNGWDKPEYDDSEWKSAIVTISPCRILRSQLIPPIKIVKTLEPLNVSSPKTGVYIFDFGQNFAGWTQLTISGSPGTVITLRHAELLKDDGTLYTENLRSAKATDIYVLKGKGIETYEPRFTYHGFRYVELTGPFKLGADRLVAKVVHTSVESIGNFTCSNSLLNAIQRNIVWGQLSNLMSIPTDCPQRDERMGWMGDAHLSAEEAIYNFWMPAFYEKWVRDIITSQNEDGSVPDVVPPHWILYPADPAWGTACVIIPYYLYQYYGDKHILEESYVCMQKWVDFLTSQTSNYIVTFSKYGDWVEPGHIASAITPGELISTGYYYYGVKIMSEVAHSLGKLEDEARYKNLAVKISNEFNRRFLDEDAAQYAKGSQTSNAFPLFLGIVPAVYRDMVLENLVNDIVMLHGGHLNTGILGTKFLVDILTELGYGNVMYRMATLDTYPSWGYWIKMGATTLWERWESVKETGPEMCSYNHIMFGSIGRWFYRDLAGIRPETPGYSRIVIKPYVPSDLKWVKAYTRTIRGWIFSEWNKTENAFFLNVTLPAGTFGKVSIPKLSLREIVIKDGGNIVWRDGFFVKGVDGVVSGYDDGDYVTFEVGSGTYAFELHGVLPSLAPELEYISLEVSKYMVEQNELVTIYATVRNPGNSNLEGEIKMYLDGKEVASKCFILKGMETKKIAFFYKFEELGDHEVMVGNMAPVRVRVIYPSIFLVALMAMMIIIVVALTVYRWHQD